MSETGSVAPLFRGLFDDASLFPPAGLRMPAALAAHARHAAAWYRDMAGPFVCSDAHLAQLRAAMTAANAASVAISLVIPGGTAAVGRAIAEATADPRLALRAVEVPVSRDAALAAKAAETGQQAAGETGHEVAVRELVAALDEAPLAGITGYVELPFSACTPAILGIVADHGYRAKLRTGGTTADGFPGERALAAALAELAARWLPFKCTAGLHHAVRHTAADTGLEHHGFLNMLNAVAASVDGAEPADLAAILADRDPGRVAGATARLDRSRAADVRALLCSIGTCSTDEPVADLVALGLASGT